jgi:hypothetical protein
MVVSPLAARPMGCKASSKKLYDETYAKSRKCPYGGIQSLAQLLKLRKLKFCTLR